MKFHVSIAFIIVALFRAVQSGGLTLPNPFAEDPGPPSYSVAHVEKPSQAQRARENQSKASRPRTLQAPVHPVADMRNDATPSVAAVFEPVGQLSPQVTTGSSDATWVVIRHYLQREKEYQKQREAEDHADDERWQYEKAMQRSADRHRAHLAGIERSGAEHRAYLAAIDRAGAERRGQQAAADAAASAERAAQASADRAAADARRAADRVRRPY